LQRSIEVDRGRIHHDGGVSKISVRRQPDGSITGEPDMISMSEGCGELELPLAHLGPLEKCWSRFRKIDPAFLWKVRHAKEKPPNGAETALRSKFADLWSVMIVALGLIFTLAWIGFLSTLIFWVVVPYI
jgi:hypothetical protein